MPRIGTIIRAEIKWRVFVIYSFAICSNKPYLQLHSPVSLLHWPRVPLQFPGQVLRSQWAPSYPGVHVHFPLLLQTPLWLQPVQISSSETKHEVAGTQRVCPMDKPPSDLTSQLYVSPQPQRVYPPAKRAIYHSPRVLWQEFVRSA